MRPAYLLTGMALILALAGNVAAQPVPYPAVVNLPEVEVRSGPSNNPELYATNKIPRGTPVEVVKELEGGWLAILPPPGSFSWINKRFLQQIGQSKSWVVLVPDDVRVPVLYGSNLRNEKPTVEGAKVQRGTQVVSYGKTMTADDGIWMPIEPPPGEVRFIRADAVVKAGTAVQASNTTVAPTGGNPPLTPVPATLTSNQATSSGFASPGVVSDPTWQQAQQAEQSGNRAEAIRLYELYGNSVRNTDSDLAMKAYTRAQFLRDQNRTAPPSKPTAPATYPIPPANDRLTPVPASLRASAAPSPCVPCTPCVPCQTTSSSPGALQRTGAGRLRRSALKLNGQSAYALENSQGQLRMYVTPQPGVNLESYVDRYVDLTGRIDYLGWPPAYRIHAIQVSPVQ